MKKKIEEILKEYLVTDMYGYYGSDGSEDDAEHQIAKAVNDLVGLFPRPRFPEKDGWPVEAKEQLYLVKHKNGFMEICTMRDVSFVQYHVQWYIPASEIINLGEK